jgi:hypothetical protein
MLLRLKFNSKKTMERKMAIQMGGVSGAAYDQRDFEMVLGCRLCSKV